MISAESFNETEVFSVTITSPDPYEAEHIANTLAKVLPEKIAGVVEGSSVRIVDYAVVPSQKVSPNLQMYALIGLLLGMLLSGTVIVILEIMDDRIHSEDYLLESFGSIPLLSVIPDMADEKQKDQYYYSNSYYTKSTESRPVRRRQNHVR